MAQMYRIHGKNTRTGKEWDSPGAWSYDAAKRYARQMTENKDNVELGIVFTVVLVTEAEVSEEK